MHLVIAEHEGTEKLAVQKSRSVVKVRKLDLYHRYSKTR